MVPVTLPLTDRTPTSTSASTSPDSPMTSSFSEITLPVIFPSTRRTSRKRTSPWISVPSARKPLMSSWPTWSLSKASLLNGMTNPPFIFSAPLRRARSMALLRGHQELVESLQLFVAVEVDLDSAPLLPLDDPDLRGQSTRQPVGRGLDVRIPGCGPSLRRPPSSLAGLPQKTGHAFLGLADREQVAGHLFGDLHDDGRDPLDAGDLGGAPAALSRDEAVPVGLLFHDDRLDDTVLPDRFHQPLQPAEVNAGLIAVRLDSPDIQQQETRVGRLGRFRDEAAQSFAECLSFHSV